MINQTSFKLENNTFEPIQIDESQVQQVCLLICQSFLNGDPVYIKYLTNIKQVYEETKYYVQASVRQNLAFGLKLIPSNKIVGITLFYDISSIKQVHEKALRNQDQSMSKYYNAYKIYDQIVNIMMNLKDFKKMEAVQGMYFSIHPQFAKYQLGPLCQAFVFRKIFDIGYQKIFEIIYNPASLRIVTNFGGRTIVKQKNQDQNLEFCLVQLQKDQSININNYIEIHRLDTLKQRIKIKKIKYE